MPANSASLARPTPTSTSTRARTSTGRSSSRSTPPSSFAPRPGGLVEARARRARHEHRSVPVGRGPLQAHAGDLGGAARLAHAVLGADEVAARHARHRTAQGDERHGSLQRGVLGPTIDEKAWRASEPRTPNPYARLEAAAELSRNGIAVSVLVAPLMPGINDDPRQVEKHPRARGRGRRRQRQRHPPPPARRGQGHRHGLAARRTGPTSSRATSSSTAAAPTRRRASASA